MVCDQNYKYYGGLVAKIIMLFLFIFFGNIQISIANNFLKNQPQCNRVLSDGNIGNSFFEFTEKQKKQLEIRGYAHIPFNRVAAFGSISDSRIKSIAPAVLQNILNNISDWLRLDTEASIHIWWRYPGEKAEIHTDTGGGYRVILPIGVGSESTYLIPSMTKTKLLLIKDHEKWIKENPDLVIKPPSEHVTVFAPGIFHTWKSEPHMRGIIPIYVRTF